MIHGMLPYAGFVTCAHCQKIGFVFFAARGELDHPEVYGVCDKQGAAKVITDTLWRGKRVPLTTCQELLRDVMQSDLPEWALETNQHLEIYQKHLADQDQIIAVIDQIAQMLNRRFRMQ